MEGLPVDPSRVYLWGTSSVLPENSDKGGNFLPTLGGTEDVQGPYAILLLLL